MDDATRYAYERELADAMRAEFGSFRGDYGQLERGVTSRARDILRRIQDDEAAAFLLLLLMMSDEDEDAASHEASLRSATQRSRYPELRAEQLGKQVAANTRERIEAGGDVAVVLGDDRAESIGTTETTAAISAGSQVARDSVPFKETLTMVWITEKDGRVCFPKGTMVATDKGERPIDTISPGDMVHTRRGLRPVIAVSKRVHRGGMTTLRCSDGRLLTSTTDHPIWKQGAGWRQAAAFVPGDCVQLIGNQQVNVECVVNFRLGDSTDKPATALKKRRFSGISLGVSVPVSPVNLKGHASITQKKINGIPSNFSLLHERHADRCKCNPNSGLDRCLSIVAPVARLGAKHNRRLRPNAYCLAAGLASPEYWRAPAFFRAVPPVAATLPSERLAAPFTRDIFGQGVLALKAARFEPLFDGCLYRERLGAYLTGLGGVRDSREPTLATAKSPSARLAVAIHNLAAMWAGNITASLSPLMVAIRGTKRILAALSSWLDRCRTALSALINKRHDSHPSAIHEPFYQMAFRSPITVYDIQVGGAHEFYANGILVHNCHICAPLHGQPESKWEDKFPMGPPAHVNCRCFTIPATLRSYRSDFESLNSNANINESSDGLTDEPEGNMDAYTPAKDYLP